MKDRARRIIENAPRGFPKFEPGAGWGLKNFFFLNMALLLPDGPRILKFVLEDKT